MAIPVRSSRHGESAGGRPDLSQKQFRTDIEGLRAVAVLAVVLFHAGVPGVGGGFIGVDVFFVVSGFLITGLLWREMTGTGTVEVARFYGARARRLLPAAATVLAVTAAGAAVLLPPLQARSVIGDGIASALYVGNYRFALHGADYLAADAPSPFQHYWSLGVEEQFYLLWPALIIGTAWLVARTTRRFGVAAPRSATPYALVLALVAVVSFAISLAWTHSLPSWAFFSLPSRAWELAVGGLVALTASRWRHLPGPSAAVVGWGGLALIVITCTQVGETTPYPGTAALLPVLGTALVVGAGCATPDLGVGHFLSAPAMRAVGRLSYSWYLWHWPVLLLAPALFGAPLGLAGRLAMVMVSFGLADSDAAPHREPGPVRALVAVVCCTQSRRWRSSDRVGGVRRVGVVGAAARSRRRWAGRGPGGCRAGAVSSAAGVAGARTAARRGRGVGGPACGAVEPFAFSCCSAIRETGGVPQRVCAVVARGRCTRMRVG